MAQQGLVKRQAQGVSALYQVADPAVYELCELVCGSIGRRHAAQMPAQSWFVQST
jgi:hypothetical protein